MQSWYATSGKIIRRPHARFNFRYSNNVDPISAVFRYEQTWGWSDSGKRAEMRENDALYLLAWEEDQGSASATSSEPSAAADAAPAKMPVAMCHFRFEYDEYKKNNIVYLYEIQATAKVQNHGLGTWMMKILEMLAFKYEMAYLALTVFEGTQCSMS
jgi:hypothetical protein